MPPSCPAVGARERLREGKGRSQGHLCVRLFGIEDVTHGRVNLPGESEGSGAGR